MLKKIGVIFLLLTAPANNAMEMPNNQNTLSTLLFGNDKNDRDQEVIARALVMLAIAEFAKGNLHLFDGLIGNNQCHITALRIVELYNCYKKGSLSLDPDHLTYYNRDKSVERFLTLNLILSSSIKNNKGPLIKYVFAQRYLKAMGLEKKHKTKVNLVLSNKEVLTFAKETLSVMVMDYLATLILSLEQEQPELALEISKLMRNDLRTIVDNISLPVLAKLPGIELLIDRIKKDNISLIIKVKTICQGGSHCAIYKSTPDYTLNLISEPIPSDEPVIVIEGIGSVNQAIRTFNDYRKLRDECAHNLLAKKKVKVTDHECLLCTHAHNCNCEQFKSLDGFDCISLQRAISADFMYALQSKLSELINNGEFPLLTEKSKEYLELAHKQGTCQKDISLFYIEHMYASTLKCAIKQKRLVDSTEGELIAISYNS